MGLRINTNMGALAAQRQLSLTSRKLESTTKQLASGDRFADFSEGSADYAIAENLKGQIAGMKAAKNNAENASSFVQIAEGGLSEQNNILIRQRELAVQAASDTFSDSERDMLDTEFQQLGQESDRIAQSTQFGNQKLLNGQSKQYEFQVGSNAGPENIIKYNSQTNTTNSSLGTSGNAVSSKSDARTSLESIDEAMQTVAAARANFGAMQSRLDSADANAAVQIENLTAAHSRLADTDVASAVSEMYKQKALQQYQLQVLDSANQYPANIVKFIG